MFPVPVAQMGMLAFLATVVMLFAAFTSAYLVRRAMPDWYPIAMPPILIFNTVVLLLSSAAVERIRAVIRKEHYSAVRLWLSMAISAGVVFLTGQIVAWNELAGQGVFLSSNPHSSFFYILTGLHGVHLVGGLLFFLYLRFVALRKSNELLVRTRFQAGAIYWHALSGIWLFLFVIIFAL